MSHDLQKERKKNLPYLGKECTVMVTLVFPTKQLTSIFSVTVGRKIPKHFKEVDNDGERP